MNAVFVAQEVQHLPVEDLPGELPGLVEDRPAVFGVGVVAEVRTLVDKTLALGVHHDAPRIAVLLELVSDPEIAEFGRVPFPADRVAARPVAGRRGAHVERHADHVSGVEARAAHLGKLPIGSEITGAPLRVRLEAAAREHHGLAPHFHRFVLALDAHAAHTVVVVDQFEGARRIPDVDALLLRGFGQRIDQPLATAPGLHRESAPELEAAVHLERLPAPDRNEAHAFRAHPRERLEAFRYQKLGEVGVAAVLRDATHIVEELVRGIGAEVRLCDLVVGEIGHERFQILHAVVYDAHRAGGEARVTAGLVRGRALEDQHACAMLARGERGAQRGVAAAHDDHILFLGGHCEIVTRRECAPVRRLPSIAPALS